KNNFFTGFDKTSVTAGETMMQGIRCGSTCYVWNNTFFLNALTNKPTTNIETPSDTQSAYCAINIAAGTPEIKNNIFISNEDAFFNFLIRGGVSGITNNNLYFLRAGNTKARINMNYTTPYATFAAYRADNALMDVNSKNADVNFVDIATGDLRIAPTSYQDANLQADRLTDVLNDMFGTPRYAQTYKGAHEAEMFLINEHNNVSQTPARIIRTLSGIEVQLDRDASIELYSINGMLIDKARTNGTYTRNLNAGIYIIRIDGKATKFVK
ncbi:MAG: T9SS type A sorting domain-containing protein, partial [Paludibacter sp.]